MFKFLVLITFLQYSSAVDLTTSDVLAKLIKAVDFLGSLPDFPGFFATQHLVYAQANLECLKRSSIPSQFQGDVDYVYGELAAFIADKTTDAIKEIDFDVRNYFSASDWSFVGNLHFKTNMMIGPDTSCEAPPKNLIYFRTFIQNSRCEHVIEGDTEFQAVRNWCGIGDYCLAQIMNTQQLGAMSALVRVFYILNLSLLKCDEIESLGNISGTTWATLDKLCNWIYKDVMTLINVGVKLDESSWFIQMVVYCSSLGYADFLNTRIANEIYDFIDSNGAILNHENPTSMLIHYLAALLRWLIRGTSSS